MSAGLYSSNNAQGGSYIHRADENRKNPHSVIGMNSMRSSGTSDIQGRDEERKNKIESIDMWTKLSNEFDFSDRKNKKERIISLESGFRSIDPTMNSPEVINRPLRVWDTLNSPTVCHRSRDTLNSPTVCHRSPLSRFPSHDVTSYGSVSSVSSFCDVQTKKTRNMKMDEIFMKNCRFKPPIKKHTEFNEQEKSVHELRDAFRSGPLMQPRPTSYGSLINSSVKNRTDAIDTPKLDVPDFEFDCYDCQSSPVQLQRSQIDENRKLVVAIAEIQKLRSEIEKYKIQKLRSDIEENQIKEKDACIADLRHKVDQLTTRDSDMTVNASGAERRRIDRLERQVSLMTLDLELSKQTIKDLNEQIDCFIGMSSVNKPNQNSIPEELPSINTSYACPITPTFITHGSRMSLVTEEKFTDHVRIPIHDQSDTILQELNQCISPELSLPILSVSPFPGSYSPPNPFLPRTEPSPVDRSNQSSPTYHVTVRSNSSHGEVSSNTSNPYHTYPLSNPFAQPFEENIQTSQRKASQDSGQSNRRIPGSMSNNTKQQPKTKRKPKVEVPQKVKNKKDSKKTETNRPSGVINNQSEVCEVKIEPSGTEEKSNLRDQSIDLLDSSSIDPPIPHLPSPLINHNMNRSYLFTSNTVVADKTPTIVESTNSPF